MGRIYRKCPQRTGHVVARRRTARRHAATVLPAEHPLPCRIYMSPIIIDEFYAEKDWWGIEVGGLAARVEKEPSWKVDMAAIQASGFNLDQKSPYAAEAVSHGPDEFLRDHVRLQIEAQLLRDPLKAILGESLGARR